MKARRNRVTEIYPFVRDPDDRVRWVTDPLRLDAGVCPACGEPLTKTLRDHRGSEQCARNIHKKARALGMLLVHPDDLKAAQLSRYALPVRWPKRIYHYVPERIADILSVLRRTGQYSDTERAALVLGPKEELDRTLALAAFQGVVVPKKQRKRKKKPPALPRQKEAPRAT